MPVARFSHYNLRVPRALLDGMRDFYRDVVGLAEGHRPPFQSHGYWLYAGDEPVLHLSEARPGSSPPSPHAASAFDHAAFTCTDRPAYERLFAARGISFRTARVPQTGQVQLFITDPSGNGVELNFNEREEREDRDAAQAPQAASQPDS